MTTVKVSASSSYNIHIGAGLRFEIASYVSEFPGIQKVCIVSDTNVFPLYGEEIINTLESSGFSVCSFVFPSGEESKNGTTYLKLLQHLAACQLTRSDLIIALGGGVVGDLAGFAAATYLRGIRLIQIPTTLLAAVDSSVGGKTAIDLPAGKNLAGAFYQPGLVLCDTDTLNTLPDSVFRDGCAEVIKYAILYDPDLFDHLEKYGLQMNREEVITRCVQWKRDAVEADEFDLGLRKKLNLGHTLGHAVEKISDYSISHGSAVAIGTAIISRSAKTRGICSAEDVNRIIALLSKFSLPIHTPYDAETLLRHTLSDKKRSGSTLDFIIPQKIGECAIVSTPISQIQEIIQAGL